MSTPAQSGTDVPRVLVLMATYNGAAWIEEQVASVLQQRGVALEIRVSDDRSSDGTAEILERMARSGAPVRVDVRESPSGSAGANFRGLLRDARLEQVDFVAFCDQDDVWDPDHLARGCAALRASGAAGYSCAVQAFGGGGGSRVIAQSNRRRALDFLFEGAGQGCTFVLTRALAHRVQQLCRSQPGPTGALHYHDWMVYLVARASDDPWFFDPNPSLHYRQHGANEIGARGGRAAIANRLALIRNGWFAGQVEAALALARLLMPGDARLERFARVFLSDPSIGRRWRLAVEMLRASRRRRVDAAVLFVAAVAGWL